jgi:hypothetical protein
VSSIIQTLLFRESAEPVAVAHDVWATYSRWARDARLTPL